MSIIVAGKRIEARHIDGPEPALVFLHEGLGSAGLWRDFPDRACAATGRGGFVYSRLGYGSSDPAALPRPLTYLEDEAALLPAVLDAAGIERAVLVGHSDGASIALAAAAAEGGSAGAHHGATAEGGAAVHGASAAGAGALPTGRARRVLGVAALAPHVDVEAANVEAIRAAGERYRSGDLRTRLARHHHHVDVAFRGWHDAWTEPAFARWSIVEALRAVTVPTLVVQGTADPYGSAGQARKVEAAVSGPVEVVLLADTGHDPARERPEETLAAVVGLVGRSTGA